MAYRAVTTYTKTASGRLFSPDLFDVNTGNYPISPVPALPHSYPKDGNGVIPYFDFAEVDSTSIPGVLVTTGPTVVEEWDPTQAAWVRHDLISTIVKTWTFRTLTETERAALTMRTTFSAVRERAKYTVPGGKDSNGDDYPNRAGAAVASLTIEYLDASGAWIDCTPGPTSTDASSGTVTWTSVPIAIPAASMSSTPSFRVRLVGRDRDERSWAIPAPPSDTVSVTVAATYQVVSAPVIS